MRNLAFQASLLLVFAIPWEYVVSSGFGTVSKTVGLFVGAIWILKVLVTGEFRRPLPVHLVIVAFVLWNAATLFWTVSLEKSWARIQTYIQIVGFVAVFWDLYTTQSAVKTAMQVYVLGAYVAIVSLLHSYLSGGAFDGQRFSAGEFHPNSIAFVLTLGLPVAWHLAMEGRSFWLKLVNYAFVPAAFFAMLLTGSRAGFLAAIPAVLYMILSLTRIRLYFRIALIATSVLVFLLIQPYAPRASLERLGTTGTEMTDGDFNGRVRIWREGAAIFSENPVLGVGSGAFSAATELGKAPHNLALSLLVEVGIVGFSLYAAIVLMVAMHIMTRPKWPRRFWLAVLFVWLLASAVHNFEHKKPTWLFFSLAVASARLREPVPRPVLVEQPAD